MKWVRSDNLTTREMTADYARVLFPVLALLYHTLTTKTLLEQSYTLYIHNHSLYNQEYVDILYAHYAMRPQVHFSLLFY